MYPLVMIRPSEVVDPLASDPVVHAAPEWLPAKPGCDPAVATPVGPG